MLALRLVAAWAGSALLCFASLGCVQAGALHAQGVEPLAPQGAAVGRGASGSDLSTWVAAGISPQNCTMPAGPGPGPGGYLDTGDLGESDLTTWTLWWQFNRTPYVDGKGPGEEGHENRRPSEDEVWRKIVPALLRTLETETATEIVTSCMIALAKIGNERDGLGRSGFEEVLRRELKVPVQEIAEVAALSLGILADEDSIAALVDLVRDSAAGHDLIGGDEVSLRTRVFAAYGLSLIGANTAHAVTRQTIVQTLVEVLEGDRSAIPDLKVACVIGLGLVPLERPDAGAAAGTEPHQSRTGQLEYLLGLLQDEQSHDLVRAHAPAALARLLEGLPAGEHQLYKQCVAEGLLARLAPRSEEQGVVVQSCVLALGQIGDNDADTLDVEIRRALIDATRDQRDPQARNFSLVALARAGGRAGLGLASGQDDVARHLTSNLASGKADLKAWAGLAIGVRGRALSDAGLPVPDATAAALRARLALERSPERLGACALGAGLLEDRDSQVALQNLLAATKDAEVRGYVSLGLGLMRARGALEPIQDAVKKSKHHPELLAQAAIAMGLLGDLKLVPDLIQMLSESRALSAQAALAAALGAIGDSRSIDPLVALLANQDVPPAARGFAAAALGILADKESLPWHSRISTDFNYRAATPTLYDQTYTGILNRL